MFSNTCFTNTCLHINHCHMLEYCKHNQFTACIMMVMRVIFNWLNGTKKKEKNYFLTLDVGQLLMLNLPILTFAPYPSLCSDKSFVLTIFSFQLGITMHWQSNHWNPFLPRMIKSSQLTVHYINCIKVCKEPDLAVLAN